MDTANIVSYETEKMDLMDYIRYHSDKSILINGMPYFHLKNNEFFINDIRFSDTEYSYIVLNEEYVDVIIDYVKKLSFKMF